MVIEKDIPIPPKRKESPKWPFGILEVGDSFALRDGPTVERQVSAMAAYYKKRLGRQFTVRTMSDGTVRCWRTA